MSMPARPGAITGPSMATYALIRYFCSSLPPQTGAATAPIIAPLLTHIARLIQGVDPPSPTLAHFRDCLDGALAAVPTALKAPLFHSFDSWFAALRPSHWSIQQIFTQLDSCMQAIEETDADVSMSRVRYVDRRSTFGIFLRRARLTYDKSDVHQQCLWARMLCQWRDAQVDTYDAINESVGLVDVPYPSKGSTSSHAPATLTRMQAFDEYQSALHRGDIYSAKEHMLTFFDHTARGSTREMHQHALLNLAALYLEMDSPAGAEPALHEAILLARSSRDWECVSACESLLKRVQAALRKDGPANTSDEEATDVDDADKNVHSLHFSTCNEREALFRKLFAEVQKHARRGDYDEALNALLSTSLLDKMLMREHTAWQAQIWRVFWLRARRRSEEGLMYRLKTMSKDVQHGDWVHGWEVLGNDEHHGTQGARSSTQYVELKMAKSLLQDYDQPQHARRLLDAIMPKMLEGDDLEVRGISRWLYAQTMLSEDASDDCLQESCVWLQEALFDFRATECLDRQGSVLYYLARLHDALGKMDERDAYAAELVRVEDRVDADGADGEALLDDVVEVVNLVGANIAVGIPV